MLTLIERMTPTNAPAMLDVHAAYYRNALRRLAAIDPCDAGAHIAVHGIADEIRQMQRTLLDACLAHQSTFALGTAESRGVYH